MPRPQIPSEHQTTTRFRQNGQADDTCARRNSILDRTDISPIAPQHPETLHTTAKEVHAGKNKYGHFDRVNIRLNAL